MQLGSRTGDIERLMILNQPRSEMRKKRPPGFRGFISEKWRREKNPLATSPDNLFPSHLLNRYTFYEMEFRTTLILRFPDVTPSGRRGSLTVGSSNRRFHSPYQCELIQDYCLLIASKQKNVIEVQHLHDNARNRRITDLIAFPSSHRTRYT